MSTSDASGDADSASDASDANTDAACQLPTGALMHVGFDEGTGTMATDPVSGLVGTLAGASWRAGRSGTAIEIGGDGATVMEFGPNAAVNMLSPITVCAWVMADTEPTVNMNVVDKTTNASVGGWALFLQGSDTSSAVRAGIMGSSGAYKYGVTDLPLGQWNHICGVWNGNPGVGALRVYHNGVEDDEDMSNAPGGGPYDDSANPLRIGGNPADGTFTLDGAVDDFILYNRILAADEIAMIHACPP
ncbi:MAG: LamG domain-containing protein [Kofleriaceae bacterium]